MPLYMNRNTVTNTLAGSLMRRSQTRPHVKNVSEPIPIVGFLLPRHPAERSHVIITERRREREEKEASEASLCVCVAATRASVVHTPWLSDCSPPAAPAPLCAFPAALAVVPQLPCWGEGGVRCGACTYAADAARCFEVLPAGVETRKRNTFVWLKNSRSKATTPLPPASSTKPSAFSLRQSPSTLPTTCCESPCRALFRLGDPLALEGLRAMKTNRTDN